MTRHVRHHDDAFNILLHPSVTEKTMAVMDRSNALEFVVRHDATKQQIHRYELVTRRFRERLQKNEMATLFAVFVVVTSQIAGDFSYMLLNPRIRFG